ncbi:hypothetical protein LCGC14_0535020 [marine sediment metagenome]|uniref:Uncharacterized protein n=1 Tax=marine sediment metagenome TaxID=412755 RepID=A0A0F9RZ18_9ZZZZ
MVNMKWKNEYKILWVLYVHMRPIAIMALLIIVAYAKDDFYGVITEPEEFGGIVIWLAFLLVLVRELKVPDPNNYPWKKKKEREEK